jgi:hypothetical protein
MKSKAASAVGIFTTLCAVLVATVEGVEPPASSPKPVVVDAERIRAAGLRVLSGKHLTLYTDLPASPAVDELPRVFDAAVPQWAHYFKVDPAKVAAWKAQAFLMKDKAKFVQAGLYPSFLPDFKNGFAADADLWLYEQPSDYYRRHLLLHEGTHGFMLTQLGSCGAPWFSEGVAELAATHSWDPAAAAGKQLTLGYTPRNREEVPGLGRIALIKADLKAGRFRSIGDLVDDSVRGYADVESYAWCWALTLFLNRHPRYQERFNGLLAEVQRPDFNAAFRKLFAADLADMNREWAVFAHELEYGVDVPRTAIEFRSGSPLGSAGAKVDVAADRGWQSSGVKLEAGKKYRVRASGRFQVATADGKPWPCEAGGVTIRYFRGKPLGMLLGAVEPDELPSGSATSLVHPQPLGLEAIVAPAKSGTLYLRINDSVGELDDNSGKLAVEITPVP